MYPRAARRKGRRLLPARQLGLYKNDIGTGSDAGDDLGGGGGCSPARDAASVGPIFEQVRHV
jgi:hypothetical protein